MDALSNEALRNASESARDFKRSKGQGDGVQLENVLYKTGKQIGSLASDAAGSATEYVKASRDYVQQNPVKGVAIAAAAGLFAGSILMMALRRKH